MLWREEESGTCRNGWGNSGSLLPDDCFLEKVKEKGEMPLLLFNSLIYLRYEGIKGHISRR